MGFALLYTIKTKVKRGQCHYDKLSNLLHDPQLPPQTKQHGHLQTQIAYMHDLGRVNTDTTLALAQNLMCKTSA